MIKANYHTHNELCGHAVGKAKDYVEKAIELGFSEIGISDHAHTPKCFMSSFDYERNALGQMMTDDEFENIYVPQVLEEKKRGNIKVFLGLETEYIEEHHDYFVDLRKKVDYLVLGLHFFKYKNKIYSSYDDIDCDSLVAYTDTAIKAMSTGLYTFFAHPDLFMYSYNSKNGFRVFDDTCTKCTKKIIDAAIKYDIYLEINANGIQNTFRDFPDYKNYLYPREEFWEIVRDSSAKIIIGADAHSPEALGNNIVEKAIEFSKKLNLKLCDFATLKSLP